MIDETRVGQVAALLLDVRRSGRLMEALPEVLRPATLDEAYAIQDRTAAALGGIGGWKSGPPEGGKATYVTVLPAADVHNSPAALPGLWPFKPEMEVEIAARFGTGLPLRAAPYMRDEVAAAIASVHPAIEVIGSRFVNRKALDPLTGIADLRSNVAMILGPPVTDWRPMDFGSVAMTLSFDGKEVAAIPGGPSTDTAVQVLLDVVNHAGGRSGGVRAGQVVITGARIRPVRVPDGTRRIVAEAAGLGRVVLTL
jgi:2-keto-4-pentenoate hydratase